MFTHFPSVLRRSDNLAQFAELFDISTKDAEEVSIATMSSAKSMSMQ